MRYFAVILGLLALSWAQLSGDYYINGCSTCATNEFPTIQAAFTALSSQGANGIVNLRVVTGYNPANEPPEPAPISLTTYTCNACRVSLIFDTVALIQRKVAPTAGSRFIFRFTGTLQNFAIRGRGNLTVQITGTAGTPSGTATGVIGLVSTTSLPLTVTGFTIDSVTVIGHNRDSVFAGIYVGQDGILTTSTLSASSSVSNLTFSNAAVWGVSRPIFVAGIRSLVQNITVQGCTIGTDVNNAEVPNATTDDPSWKLSWAATNNIGGIHIRGAQNVTVRQNIVKNALSASNYQVAGIRLDSVENFTVSRNWIYRIRYVGTGGWGSYGIALNLPSSFLGANVSNVVSHNIIAGVYGDAFGTTGVSFVSGVWVTAPGAIADAKLSLIHNSIHLYGNNGSSYAGGYSAGVTFGANVQGGVTVNGNLIQNTLKASTDAGKKAAGVVILTTTPSLAGYNVNYNSYRVASGAGGGDFIGRMGNMDYATLAAWQGAPMSPDLNGQVHLPGPVPFVADTNLHLVATSASSAINAGSSAYNGAQDFDGETRPLPNPGPGPNGDPGTAPDIGADELDGKPFTCPTVVAAPSVITSTPPNAGSDYLWGTTIQLDTTGTNSPTASGVLQVIYSLDGGATWTAGPTVGAFPVSFTLPSLTPPNYTGTIAIAIRASQAPGCPPLPDDTSNVYLTLNLTDRPGNRSANAISLTLNDNGNGTWSVVVVDSTSGPGTSDEVNAANGYTRGTPARDLFFTITLPACLDSLKVTTCHPATNYDTRIHLINATAQDTIVNEDHGLGVCSNASYGSPQWLSTIIARGIAGSAPMGPADVFSLQADSVVLRQGDVLYVVVEGFGTAQGVFGLEITGYRVRPTLAISGAPAGSVCMSAGSLTLDATTPGVGTYEWVVNGNLVPGANTATYALSLVPGTHTVVAHGIIPSYNGPVCNDTLRDTVTITVDPLPDAGIQVGSTTYPNGATYTLSGTGSASETFIASSSVSGNSYSWALYSGSTSIATGTGGSFNYTFNTAGLYTLVLTSTNGACTEYDTLYVDVTITTSLLSRAGAFSVMPNPSNGAFMVVAPAAGTYDLQVLDVAGREVYRDRMEGTRKELRLLLPAGTYQLLIRGEGRSEVVRLLITE